MKPQIEDLAAVNQSQIKMFFLQLDSCRQIKRQRVYHLELIFLFFIGVELFHNQCYGKELRNGSLLLNGYLFLLNSYVRMFTFK
jgi:hypothetical protein